MSMIIQTRQEVYDVEKKAHDEAKAFNRGKPKDQHKPVPPVSEIVQPGDVAGVDTAGNKMLVRDADINSTDVRGFDPDTGQASGWRKAAEKDQIADDWSELYG